MPDRCGFYFDGFNIYHGVDSLGQSYLKWFDPRALAQRIAKDRGWIVTETVYCTALNRRLARPDQRQRHQSFVSALKHRGITVKLGAYARSERKCMADCRQIYQGEEEKQSDTNLALAPIEGLLDDRVDHVAIVSGDSDQVPTLKFLQERFPNAHRLVVFPPNRDRVRALSDLSSLPARTITGEDLDICLLDPVVRDLNGNFVRRPREYDPPSWWVPPGNRP